MKDVDFASLNSTINEFEKTVSALEKINDISQETLQTTANLDAACVCLTDVAGEVTDSFDEIRQSLSTVDQKLAKSSERLLALSDDLVESNKNVSKDVFAASESLKNTISVQILDASKSVSNELKGISKQELITIQGKLNEEERRISEKIVAEVSTLSGIVQTVGNRLESKLQIIDDKVNEIQKIKEEIEIIKNQNKTERAWILIGAVAACIAMIASVVGIFI